MNIRISSLPVLAMALRELDDLVIHDKEPITSVSSLSSVKKRDRIDKEPYDRARYRKYALNRNTAFAELYQFCFTLSKPPSVPSTIPPLVLTPPQTKQEFRYRGDQL